MQNGITKLSHTTNFQYTNEIEKIGSADDEYGEIEEICITTKSLLGSILNSVKSEGNEHNSTFNETVVNVQAATSQRLPALKIPKFSGKFLVQKIYT